MNEASNSPQPSQLPLGVVTVTFSPDEHLNKLVDSLGPAAGVSTRLIMADNGSMDGPVEGEEARARKTGTDVQLLRTCGNISYDAAASRGIAEPERARRAGEINLDYVMLVNPDVVSAPGVTNTLLECAQRNPKAGVIGPLTHEADGSVYPSAHAVPKLVSDIGHALLADIWPTNPFSRHYRDDTDMGCERSAGWLSGVCLLLRWDAFDQIDGFDTHYSTYMEDVDLGDRLGKAGWNNVFCPHAEIRHAQGHSANKHPEITVKAHHELAYRFMSDCLPGPALAPVRLALRLGLFLRGKVIIAAKKRGNQSTVGMIHRRKLPIP